MTIRPRAYSYLRFSTPEQALGDSKRRQLEGAREWAARHGLTLDEELTDEGVSGFRGANTRDDTALGSFLRAVHLGAVPPGSYLIVESLDRLSRDRILAAQNTLLSLLLAGIIVVTLGDGREYSEESVNANPTDLLVSLLVLMRANEESETKARRMRAVWQAKRAEAVTSKRRLTVRAPAWLEADGDGFRPIPERAAVVRRIFAETIAGRGQHAVAKGLTLDGVPTWGGSQGWHRSYVRKILDNPAVIGTAVLHVTERLDGGGSKRSPVSEVRDYYPAVVQPDAWARVQSLIGARDGVAGLARRGRHSGSAVRHLLAGLARCPHCEGTMTRVSKGPGGGRAYLVCAKAKRKAGCVYRGVPVAEVDAAILDHRVQIELDAPPSGDAEARLQAALDDLETELGAIIEERSELDAARRRPGALSRAQRERTAELYALQTGLEERRREAETALAAAASPVLSARLRRLSDALEDAAKAGLPLDDVTTANASLRETFTAVVVDYMAGELRLHWRHGGESVCPYGSPFDAVEGWEP